MKDELEYLISMSGNIDSEKVSNLLNKIRGRLVAKGVSEDKVRVPVNVLILHDHRNIFLCISLSNVSTSEAKLYVQDCRQIEELTTERAISISRNVYMFQTPYVFSFSKKQLAVHDTIISVLPPYYGDLDKTKCFVVMPFTKEMNVVYNHILEVFRKSKELPIKCVRADYSLKPEVLIKHIWHQINESFFILGDLTGRNANVYYEIGLAHSIGKPVILITQDSDIPFDLQGIRHIRYSIGTESDANYFKRQLRKAVLEVTKFLTTTMR